VIVIAGLKDGSASEEAGDNAKSKDGLFHKGLHVIALSQTDARIGYSRRSQPWRNDQGT
jgi:hypothetical protein